MRTPFTSSPSRIGFAVADLDAAVAGWERLGIGPWRRTTGVPLTDFAYRCRASDAVVDIATGTVGPLTVELVRPVGAAPSSYRDAVDRGVTALHSIGWTVDDLDAALEALRPTDAGVLQAGTRLGARFAALGPTGGNGTIVELTEATAEPPTVPGRSPATASPFSRPPDQLGFAVADLDRAIDGWLQIGVGPWLTLKGAKLSGYHYRGVQSSPTLSVGFAQLGPLQLEVIQPVDAERSSYRDFLDSGGRGLQHVGWYIDDLDSSMAAVIEQGGRVLQTGSWSGVRFAYFEPEDGTGTITELIGMTPLSRELFSMVREEASVPDWDGSEHPSRNVLLAADWGLRWHAVRAQVESLLQRE